MASWTQTEETTLLSEIKSIKSIYEIAKNHNRTPGAINCRLHWIISRSVVAGTPCPVDDIRAFLKWKPHCETQTPITMEFKQTFTREKLRGLAEEHRLQQLTCFIDGQIANLVIGAATQGKTSVLYERSPHHHPHQYMPTDEELMCGLRTKFPGSSVTLSEEWVDEPHRRVGQPPTRVLKKGIKIDWS